MKLFAASLVIASIAAVAPAQQSTPASAPNAAEIHIDSHCRVLTEPVSTIGNHNIEPHYRYNHVVCHLESRLASSHLEPAPANTAGRKYVRIYVREREYLLQNTTSAPVTFIVSQPILKGWHIDSDPQPVDTTGHVATFRVHAQPHQIVRLHVGERS